MRSQCCCGCAAAAAAALVTSVVSAKFDTCCTVLHMLHILHTQTACVDHCTKCTSTVWCWCAISVQQVHSSSGCNNVSQHQELLLLSRCMVAWDSSTALAWHQTCLALLIQDGKYDRLLRLLYDDIQKYETEVGDLSCTCKCLTAVSLPADLCNTLTKKPLDNNFHCIPDTRQPPSYPPKQLLDKLYFACNFV